MLVRRNWERRTGGRGQGSGGVSYVACISGEENDAVAAVLAVGEFVEERA